MIPIRIGKSFRLGGRRVADSIISGQRFTLWKGRVLSAGGKFCFQCHGWLKDGQEVAVVEILDRGATLYHATCIPVRFCVFE
jgi:hypothetical protein